MKGSAMAALIGSVISGTCATCHDCRYRVYSNPEKRWCCKYGDIDNDLYSTLETNDFQCKRKEEKQ